MIILRIIEEVDCHNISHISYIKHLIENLFSLESHLYNHFMTTRKRIFNNKIKQTGTHTHTPFIRWPRVIVRPNQTVKYI